LTNPLSNVLVYTNTITNHDQQTLAVLHLY
jgi:hypothetical protein